MEIIQEYKRLLYQYEILRARLEIRDFFLKTTVREVYENIGQVLSLVRMQLAFIEPKQKATIREEVSSSGELVGQTIRDLRSMCRSFYPDLDILKENGFIDAIKATLDILFPNTPINIEVKGVPEKVSQGLRLIVFKMLQEILISIDELKGLLNKLVISISKVEATFVVEYKGEPINFNNKNNDQAVNPASSLTERLELIGGSFSIKNDPENTSIQFIVPLNIFQI
jgi:signal transduction histidine kinase